MIQDKQNIPLSKIIDKFNLETLSLPDLPENIPVIIGELGKFVGEYQNGKCKYFNDINRTLKTLSEEYGTFVSAEGLACKEDGIHFTSASYREFGKRYFEAYLKIRK